MNNLLRIIYLLTDYLKKPDASNRSKVYIAAVSCLGTDASPNDIAPDEVGCAETVNAIHKKAFGYEIGGGVSTNQLYKALISHSKFIGVDSPLEGDVIISPTGYGNGKLTNGHTGVMGKNGVIMSNDSSTGLFKENFTLESWRSYYGSRGGYPVKFFRRI